MQNVTKLTIQPALSLIFCLIVITFIAIVTIFHYLAVAVAELDYFETCGFFVTSQC